MTQPRAAVPSINRFTSRKSTTSLSSQGDSHTSTTTSSKKDRPAPLSNNFKNYNTLNPRRTLSGFKSPGLRKISPRPGVTFVNPVRPERHAAGDDMTGFAQFCTMCEKQIITPGNTVLYCSESCKRKDSAKSLDSSTSSYAEWCSPITSRRDSYFDLSSCTDVIPRQSPTSFPVLSVFSHDSLDMSPRTHEWEEAGIDPALVTSTSGHPIFGGYGRRTYSEQSLPALSHECGSPAPSPGSAPSRPLTKGSSSAALDSLRSIELVLPFTPAALTEAAHADPDALHMRPSHGSKYTPRKWETTMTVV